MSGQEQTSGRLTLNYRTDPDAWVAAASYVLTRYARAGVAAPGSLELAAALTRAVPQLVARPAARAALTDALGGDVTRSDVYAALKVITYGEAQAERGRPGESPAATAPGEGGPESAAGRAAGPTPERPPRGRSG